MDLEINFVITNKPEELVDWKKDGKYYVSDIIEPFDLNTTHQDQKLEDVIPMNSGMRLRCY
jgi:hypothetical protein